MEHIIIVEKQEETERMLICTNGQTYVMFDKGSPERLTLRMSYCTLWSGHRLVNESSTRVLFVMVSSVNKTVRTKNLSLVFITQVHEEHNY